MTKNLGGRASAADGGRGPVATGPYNAPPPAVPTTYREALEYLFARTTGKWRLGLDRMDALVSEIGRPQERFRVFHVAGTNGKGSVCAILDALLRSRGYSVGLYTSPHLIDFRERFLINGTAVSEQAVCDWIERRTPIVERLGATFFEATTAMGFELFAAAGVDVAVVEVGLGGRLDATNVVDPVVTGVTSIGIDHVEYLGETREEIAAEKAGIFKPGRPAVIGETDPAIRSLLARLAHSAGARPVRVVADEVQITDVRVEAAGGTSFTLAGVRRRAGPRPAPTAATEPVRLHTPLAGVHQATNAALALTMLDAGGAPYAMAAKDVQPALGGTVLPGRFQRRGPWIFDVAHNPDGVAVLAETLRAVNPSRPIAAVLCVLGDKDWRGMMEALAPVIDLFILTEAPSAPAARSWSVEQAAGYAAGRGWPHAVHRDLDEALMRARAAASTVLVTGSFHTVGDAMARLPASSYAR